MIKQPKLGLIEHNGFSVIKNINLIQNKLHTVISIAWINCWIEISSYAYVSASAAAM